MTRTLTYWMLVSLDGFIEGPNDDLDWHLVDEELHRYVNGQVRAAGAFLYGRRSYELMAGYWPFADTYACSPDYEVEFAELWRTKPKIVFSRTLGEVDWNTRVVRDDVAAEITKLKAEPGNDLVLFGGAEIAATLIRLGLVDRYRLFVTPVVVGGGKPFLATSDRLDLKLVETRTFESGVVLLNYERADA